MSKEILSVIRVTVVTIVLLFSVSTIFGNEVEEKQTVTIHLTDGTLIKGTIISQSANQIKVQTSVGELTIDTGQVEKIEYARKSQFLTKVKPKKDNTLPEISSQNFYLRGGIFKPGNDNISDIYGTGPILSLGFHSLLTSNPIVSIYEGGEAGIFPREGEDFLLFVGSVDTNLLLIPLSFLTTFKFPMRDADSGKIILLPYLAAGPAWHIARITATAGGKTASETRTALGFSLRGGLEIPLKEASTLSLELGYSYAESSEIANIGGFSIYSGYTHALGFSREPESLLEKKSRKKEFNSRRFLIIAGTAVAGIIILTAIAD